MNNLELGSVLEVAVFGLAIAQVLTILLTIRREREVRDLRELIEEQRLRLVELRGWIAGRAATQSRQIASERETRAEPAAHAKTGMPTQEDDQPRTNEDAAARSAKELEWQRDVATRMHASIQAAQVQQAATPIDGKGLGTSDDTFKWFKENVNEPREIVEARKIVADFGKGDDQQYQGLSGTTQQPSTTDDPLEKFTEAVNQLKENVARTSAITRPNGKPPAEIK